MKVLLILTIQTMYNLTINTVACVFKIGVILYLPVMYIFFLFNHKKLIKGKIFCYV